MGVETFVVETASAETRGEKVQDTFDVLNGYLDLENDYLYGFTIFIQLLLLNYSTHGISEFCSH